MRIAIATCSNLPSWEVDDAPLMPAFQSLGAQPVSCVWDDPSVDWAAFDACLIRTTWDYTSKLDAFVAWAKRVEAVTPLFNPAAIVAWNTHKSYLRELEQRGVPCIPTVWLHAGSAVNVREIMHKHGWSAGFLKPIVGATSRDTLRFTNDEAGLAAAERHLNCLLPTQGFMLQPYLPQVESHGEVSAIFIDGQYSHGVRKLPVEGDYRVQNDYGASDEPLQFDKADLDLARRIVELIDNDDLLYARVDFLRDAAGELRLVELELVEPSMFFRHCPPAALRLAEAVCSRVASRRR